MTDAIREMIEVRKATLEAWRAEPHGTEGKGRMEACYHEAATHIADMVTRQEEAIAANLLKLDHLEEGDAIDVNPDRRWVIRGEGEGMSYGLYAYHEGYDRSFPLNGMKPLFEAAIRGGAVVLKAGETQPVGPAIQWRDGTKGEEV